MRKEKWVKVITAFGYQSDADAWKQAEILGKKYPQGKGWKKTKMGVSLNKRTGTWHAFAHFERRQKS